MASRYPQLSATRRSFLAGALGIGAATVLAACGGDDSGSEDSGASGGPFEFTDDRGKKISLPAAPKKIVAQVGAAAALWDFGVQSVGIFGPSKKADGSPDPQAGRIDQSKTTSLGNAWGEFNVEKYLSLAPELLVSVMYGTGKLWYVPDDSASKIEQIAPTVGLEIAKVKLTDAIAKFEKLAAALGADVKASSVTDAKAKFDAATKDLQAAGTAKSDVKVIVLAAAQDNVYCANPVMYPDLQHYVDNKVGLVVPQKPDAESPFWETLSWENVGKYPADVIFLDARTQSLQPDQLKSNAAWAKLPAVVNNQIIPWYSEEPLSYPGYSTKIADLAAGLNKAKKVT
ncbi:ABC transporter substrate-binding protein [Virgisporangium aliadipatigenens]|uniref:ABC transporter substrate-binding protein n=1 Tax=Virgisporangium aliadipatigenens TaxID=741659 RepID=A0A8J3YJ66_9ACTN|nr:ABC transporter substrate-binding protein [Virgisporangium aliadipatigenens]GIJ44990.1 ABC transporter substrate-binding protein [Virgisporangium aliadipatigenens]